MILRGDGWDSICEVELEGRFGNFLFRATPNARIKRSQYALFVKSAKPVRSQKTLEPLHICYALDSACGRPHKITWYENSAAALRAIVSPGIGKGIFDTARAPYFVVLSKQSYDYYVRILRDGNAVLPI